MSDPTALPHSDPTDQDRVRAAWPRVAAWLGRHAPASHQRLRPGVGEDEVAGAERRMGEHVGVLADFHRARGPEAVDRLDPRVVVPPALRTWWTLCDGAGPVLEWEDGEDDVLARAWLPGWYSFVSLAGAVELHARISDNLVGHPEYTGQWIPFAMFDPDGLTGYFVDARPTAPTYGHVAEWALEDHFTCAGATPLPDWLEALADALDEGRGLHAAAGGPAALADWPCLRQGALRWLDLRADEHELNDEGWRPVNDPR